MPRIRMGGVYHSAFGRRGSQLSIPSRFDAFLLSLLLLAATQKWSPQGAATQAFHTAPAACAQELSSGSKKSPPPTPWLLQSDKDAE